MLDPIEFGKAMAGIVRDATAPLLKRIEQLESRQLERGEDGPVGPTGEKGIDGQAGERGPTGEQGPAGERGEKGEQGPAGKDAEPIDLQEVIAELSVAPEVKTVLSLMVAEAAQEGVAKHFAAHPVRDGRDGKDGEPGPRGVEGAKGDPGRDGLDIKDFFRAEGGRLMAVLSDGTTRDLGEFVGKDGQNGRDGLSVESLSREYLPETHEIRERWTASGVEKSITYPAGGIHHGGYWREGTKAKAGQTWVRAGTCFIAKTDTDTIPDRTAECWEIFASKGRDGNDGKDGKLPPGPVKLNGD